MVVGCKTHLGARLVIVPYKVALVRQHFFRGRSQRFGLSIGFVKHYVKLLNFRRFILEQFP